MCVMPKLTNHYKMIILFVTLCFTLFACEKSPSLEYLLSGINLKEAYEAAGGDNYNKGIAFYGPIENVNISEYSKNLIPTSLLPVRIYYDGKNAMLLCVPEVFPSDEGNAFLGTCLGMDDYSDSQPTLYTEFLIFGDGAFPTQKSGVYTYLGPSKSHIRKARLIVTQSFKVEIIFLVYDGAREWEIASVKFQLKRKQPFDGILNLPIQYYAKFPLARSFYEIDWENN